MRRRAAGPARAPSAAPTTSAMSAPVDATTRAVNVDALNPWSIVRIRYCSSARAASGVGVSPVTARRYAAVGASSGRWSIGSWPEADAVQGGDDRRDDGGDAQGLCLARSSGSMSMSGRTPSSSAAIETAARTRPSVGPVARASGSRTGTSDAGRTRAAATSLRNASSSASSGSVPRATRCQTASNGWLAGELGRVVAAVVVEAGLPVDVTDGGLGDGDAVEPGGDVDQRGHATIVDRCGARDQR